MEHSIPRNHAGLAWMVQALSGLLLVVLLFLHIIANHFTVQGGLQTYRDVVNYLGSPWIFALETVFLVVVTTHAMLGVRAILLDTGLARRFQQVANWTLTVLGAVIVVYAVWLTNTIIHQ